MREAVEIYNLIQAGVTVLLSDLQSMPAYVGFDLLDITQGRAEAERDAIKKAEASRGR